jgi:hypothetical protein
VRTVRRRLRALLEGLGPRRLHLSLAAMASTGLGALLLAFSTRRPSEGFLAGITASVVSLVLLVGGVLLGSLWLGAELANEELKGTSLPEAQDGSREADGLGQPATQAGGSSPRSEGGRRVHKVVLACALLAGASAGAVMGQMGNLLLGFHQPGEVSANHAALQGAGNPLGRDEQIDEALLTWSRFARSGLHLQETDPVVEVPTGQAFREDRNAPVTALTWFFGLDAGIFVPAYFSVFGLLLVLGMRTLYTRETSIKLSSSADPEVFRRIARCIAVLAIVTALADQVENWSALTFTSSAWFAGDPDPSEMTVSAWMAAILGFATLVKIVCFAATVLGLIFIGLYLMRNGAKDEEHPWVGNGGAWQSVLAVRIQIIALALFAFLMSFRIQAADTFIRLPDDWLVAFLAALLVVLLSVAIWHSGRWLMALAIQTKRERAGEKLARWLLVVAAVALFIFGSLAGWAVSRGLVVPLAIVAVVIALSWVVRDAEGPDPSTPGMGSVILPRLLGASVLAFFGLAVLKASSGELIYRWMRGYRVFDLVVLVVGGLLFVGASMLAYLQFARANDWHSVDGSRSSRADSGARKPDRPGDSYSRWTPSLSLLICLVVWIALVTVLASHVFSLAPALGIAGVMALFLILLTYTLSSAVAVSTSAIDKPAAVFRAAGFGRTPILSLIILWALVVSLVPVPFVQSGPVAIPRETGVMGASGETLEAAFTEWLDDNCLMGAAQESESAVGSRTMPVAPLILVSSSGGGIKAAVWTSLVMDKLFGYTDPSMPCSPPDAARGTVSDASRWVFAASGISGGSLGFAQYVAQLTHGPPSRSAESRIRDHLGDDSLAQTLAWMLLVETPWSLLRFSVDRDRGDILEQSWERQWPDGQPGLRQNYLELRDKQHVPLLLLNGTSAESGCRFNGSILNADGRDRGDAVIGCLEPQGLEGSPEAVFPATIDLVSFLCEGQDISLAEAALLSARFPVISPVAVVQQCDAGEAGGVESTEVGDPDPETFVVDGGYLDGSGTATALDVWNALAPMLTNHNLDPDATACVVPFFVQIDNSYLEPSGPGDTKAPPRFVVLQELSAFGRSSGGYTTTSRQAAQIAFGRAFTLGGVDITTSAGTGLDDRYVRLSPVAHPGAEAPLGWTLSDAAFQDLFDQYERNRSAIREVESWFEGMTCTVGPTP